MLKINKEVFSFKNSKIKNLTNQLRSIIAISKKDLRIYYNKPPVIVQGIIFPVILFFTFTIGRDISTPLLISGLMAMVLFLTATSIGPFIFPWETMRKTLERLITCPVSIKTILIGSMISSFLFGVIFSLVPLVLGIIFFSIEITMSFVIILIAMFLAAFVFSSFSLILSAPPTDMPGNIMIFTLLLKFTILFLSPLFMPISNHPIAWISPLTYFIDIVNVCLGLESAFGKYGILIDFGVLGFFGVFFLFLSFMLHKKTLQKRFRN